MTNGRPHVVVNGRSARSFREAFRNMTGERIVIDMSTSFSDIGLKGG
jgi:hypothetical protein